MDPQRYVRFLQLFGRLTLTWPPEQTGGIFKFTVDTCFWYIVILTNVTCMILMMLKIFRFDDSSESLSNGRSFSVLCIIADSFFQIILMRLQWPRFQFLLQKVINYLEKAEEVEKEVCRKYMRRYIFYHIWVTTSVIATIVAFASGPFILNGKFPLDGWYPFSIEITRNRVFVYVIQYTTILTAFGLVSGDFMMVLLLLYSSMRLEILGTAMRKVEKSTELRECVKTHIELISFVRETNLAIDLVILKSLVAVSVIILTAGIQLAYERTWVILLQFLLVVCVASMRIFGCACAGDDLTEMASRLSWSIYQSPAIVRALGLSRIRLSMSIVIQRCRRTLVVTLWGRNLVLSLSFFAKYTMRVLSFFMTLKAVVDRYV